MRPCDRVSLPKPLVLSMFQLTKVQQLLSQESLKTTNMTQICKLNPPTYTFWLPFYYNIQTTTTIPTQTALPCCLIGTYSTCTCLSMQKCKIIKHGLSSIMMSNSSGMGVETGRCRWMWQMQCDAYKNYGCDESNVYNLSWWKHG